MLETILYIQFKLPFNNKQKEKLGINGESTMATEDQSEMQVGSRINMELETGVDESTCTPTHFIQRKPVMGLKLTLGPTNHICPTSGHFPCYIIYHFLHATKWNQMEIVRRVNTESSHLLYTFSSIVAFLEQNCIRRIAEGSVWQQVDFFFLIK